MQAVVFPKQLTLQEKAQFFYQLAALLNSGVTLQQSFNIAAKDYDSAFGRYLQTVSTAVAGSQDLASALALDRRYFDNWTIALIRLAEYSSSLPQTFRQLALAAEAEARRRRLYRSVKLSVLIIVWSLLILTAVIFNRTPMGFIRPQFWLRSLAIAFLLWGISVLASRYFSRGSSPWLRNLPLVGKLIQARSLLYLAQLQLPLSCGIPILTALELLREHIPDVVMRANVARAARQIRAGQSLSHSLEGKLLPIAAQMIRTGEETGNLDTALENMAQYYEGDLERRLQSLESRLQPLRILAIASLIGAVAIRAITLLLNLLPD